ncbi:MAG: hypothetical protein LUO88_04645 [Methanoregulaceae archaeon]|nr:hypothetical protein [Methanoregulaceae archaeon]
MVPRVSFCVAGQTGGPSRSETYLLEERESAWTAYPVGLKEFVIGRGSSPSEALDSARQELERHIERVGRNMFGIK